jgi:hypothetical protein
MPKKQKQKNKKSATKKRRGGSNSGLLAYPYKGPNLQNPALAYTGNNGSLKGGYNDRMYPAKGPPSGGFSFPNSLQTQYGGHGSSYPNGLVGSPYNNPNNLPGVNGIPGDSNYYENNINPTLQTATLISAGANRPFLRGGTCSLKRGGNKFNGGKYLKGGCGGTCALRGGKRKRNRQSGGFSFSNSMGQELINLGRNVPFALNSAYNGFFGYSPPINPSPLVGQLARPIQRI